ncbi:MAG TPA: hypothetical protein PK771_06350 [Spirochaetota bacterium]|nr:hypothetical protein [Spirochaetota bacterium]
MKNLISVVILLLLLTFSCKSGFKGADVGGFSLVNYSGKTVEFVWLAKTGEFYPTAKNLNIGYGEMFEVNGLETGLYDIAIDFKNEYNSFNSKKDKSLCLSIEKGIKKIWVIDSDGNVIRN